MNSDSRIPAGRFNDFLREEIVRVEALVKATMNIVPTSFREMESVVEEVHRLSYEGGSYRRILAGTANYGDRMGIARSEIAVLLLAEARRADTNSGSRRQGIEDAVAKIQGVLDGIVPSVPLVPSVLDGIDWRLLRDQKAVLLAVIDHFRKGSVIHDGPETRTAVADAMEGILHLIDAVQDAADTVGLMPADGWLTETSGDDAAVPRVWRSTDDPDADDWTIESADGAVYGPLADIAGRLLRGDHYLAERGAEDSWTVVTADGSARIAQCPTEEEAVALIGALRAGGLLTGTRPSI